jgi:Holliday junction resolvase
LELIYLKVLVKNFCVLILSGAAGFGGAHRAPALLHLGTISRDARTQANNLLHLTLHNLYNWRSLWMIMSLKSKGINAERELVHYFWSKEIPCIRVAGSGSMKYPAPDLIVGSEGHKALIEVKVTKEKQQYFTPEEIKDLLHFSVLFGGKPYVAIKFNRVGWIVLNVESLEKTEHHYAANVKDMGKKGYTLDEFSVFF